MFFMLNIDNCDFLRLYRDNGIMAMFYSGQGETTEGYIHKFDINRGRHSHVELSDFPERSENAGLVYASKISVVEPVDKDKAKASLLEKHSPEATERILDDMLWHS